jgi:hypothetical protein
MHLKKSRKHLQSIAKNLKNKSSIRIRILQLNQQVHPQIGDQLKTLAQWISQPKYRAHPQINLNNTKNLRIPLKFSNSSDRVSRIIWTLLSIIQKYRVKLIMQVKSLMSLRKSSLSIPIIQTQWLILKVPGWLTIKREVVAVSLKITH